MPIKLFSRKQPTVHTHAQSGARSFLSDGSETIKAPVRPPEVSYFSDDSDTTVSRMSDATAMPRNAASLLEAMAASIHGAEQASVQTAVRDRRSDHSNYRTAPCFVEPVRPDARDVIAAHPLPNALANLDPYTRPKVRAKSRRTSLIHMPLSKGKPTAATHKETFYASLTTLSKSIEDERLAREKMRLMLGGENYLQAEHHAKSSRDQASAFLNSRDEALLQKCENMGDSGAVMLMHRAEIEHIARFGLAESIRLRAAEVLKKNDPFSEKNWKKVDRPFQKAANGASNLDAQNHDTAKNSLKGKAPAVAQEPRIDIVMEASRLPDGTKTKQVAELVAPDGTTYLVTEPIARGGFKSFGVGLTEDQKPVGVLTIRGRHGFDIFADDDLPGGFPDDLVLDEVNNITKFSDEFEIHKVFSIDNMWFLVVPLFDGGDLRKTLGAIDVHEREEALVRLLPDMIQQIILLHRKQGAIHGDVKLENFLLTTSGRVVLADFGLTKFLNVNKVIDNSLEGGTYFAPEQISQYRGTPAIDFWALGASLGDAINFNASPKRPMKNPHVPAIKYGFLDAAEERKKLFAFGEYRMGLFENQGGREGIFNAHRLFLNVPDEREAVGRGLAVELPEQRYLDWFTSYYRLFFKRAPLLASFCLEHLLEPNPAIRAQNPDELLGLATLMRASLETMAGASEGASKTETVKFPQDPAIAAAIASLHRARQSRDRNRAAAA